MSLELVTGPAVEPISVSELKLQQRITHATEDSLLSIYIAAARRKAEQLTRRAFITQTWRQRLDAFPSGEIKLLKPPVASITSVAYIDGAGDSQTLGSSLYTLDRHTMPGWLYPADGTTWPATDDVVNAVTITMVCGFGAAASDVPEDIKAWLLLVAGFLAANRESMDATGRIAELPGRFTDGLLDRWRVYGV